MEIITVDLADEASRRAWFAIEQDVVRHDLRDGWERSYESFEASALQPDNPYRQVVRLAALDEDAWTGTAEVGLPVRDNVTTADVEIAVLPAARGRGAGSALFERVEQVCAEHGRTTLFSELHLPAGEQLEASASGRFAATRGFTCVHREDHLVLDLPVETDQLRALARRDSDAYEIVLWGERCPDELVADYCAMRSQMATDVPTGELDLAPVVYDEERLRTGEQRLARGWIPIVAAARRRADGVMGGYSTLVLPRGGDLAMQDDTLVMPEHRGHRLGTALKLATLDVLRRDHPERRALHTWTEPDNHAMQRTNADFGYTARNRLHELQRKA